MNEKGIEMEEDMERIVKLNGDEKIEEVIVEKM